MEAGNYTQFRNVYPWTSQNLTAITYLECYQKCIDANGKIILPACLCIRQVVSGPCMVHVCHFLEAATGGWNVLTKVACFAYSCVDFDFISPQSFFFADQPDTICNMLPGQLQNITTALSPMDCFNKCKAFTSKPELQQFLSLLHCRQCSLGSCICLHKPCCGHLESHPPWHFQQCLPDPIMM